MRLDTIKPAQGANTTAKRLGRGTGSGLGKTSGKGHKGQWSRSGGGVRPGFEGGQMPITRRLPKKGFHNKWEKVYAIVNVGDLDCFENGVSVSIDELVYTRIVTLKHCIGIKVLGNGTLTKKLNVRAHKFSASAIKAIEACGGTAEVVE